MKARPLTSNMFARTDLIRRIGGFDEDFSLYGEDRDLCLSIRRAGFRRARREHTWEMRFERVFALMNLI